MKHTTRPPTSSTPSAPDGALRVGSILTGLLPATLHTSAAPERYTVSPVFSRRPTAGEIAALDGDEAREWLTQSGYPQVQLRVSDRRLEIRNTNLKELAGGLAVVVAILLARISVEEDDRVREAGDELSRLDAGERERWAAVRSAAVSVDFTRSNSTDEGPGRPGSTPLGLARVDAELLPPELGTPEAPEKYTVPTEFTRSLTATEAGMIEGEAPRRELDNAGYRDVRLQLHDRRLDIHGTNLEELSSGLSRVIADLLVELGAEAAEKDIAEVLDTRRRNAMERDRAAAVVAEAAAIDFAVTAAPEPAQPDPQAAHGGAAAGDRDEDQGEERPLVTGPQPHHYS